MKSIAYAEMVSSAKELISTGSVFKGSIFRSALRNEQVSDRTVRDYLTKTMNFITKWADYADEIEEALKDADKPGKAWINVSYDDIKPYLYADYDYASVLPFADGVLRGIDSGRFSEEEDISDFFDHTASKAFKDRESSTAGMLEEVYDIFEKSGEDADSKELSYFASIKGQKLFDRRDSKELYKAIEKVCQYIQTRLNEDSDFVKRDAKLMISVVNYIVEYMTYSAVAYGTRVFIIGLYVGQFVGAKQFDESLQQQDSLDVGFMQMADDKGFRDIANVEKISTFMCEWLKRIGVPDDDNLHGCAASWQAGNSNVFFTNTIGNQLREYIMSAKFNDCVLYSRVDLRYFEDIREMLKSLTHNSLQALQGTSTAKQEMLTYIKTLKPEKETVEGYTSLAKDLVEYVLMLLNKISKVYTSIQRWSIEEHNHPTTNNSAIQISTEVSTMIAELYRELSTALLTRARDIEMTIDHINNEKTTKRMAELKIKVPGEKKDDLSNNDNTMMGVPDTTRVSVDLSPYYAIPTMESLEMYDEYVRSLPGMAADPYYEAVNISSLVNAITSILAAIRKKVENFFNNRQFKAAVKWCQEHQSQMMQMTFTGPIEVLPYKKDLSITHIDKMVNSIQNEFSAETVKSKENLDRFINSLYDGGNTKLIEVFNDTKLKPAEQAQRYQNWILFGKDPTETSKVATKVLNTNEEIRNELQNVWFDNVVNSTETYRGLISKSQQLDTAFNSMKAKVVSVTGNRRDADNATSANGASEFGTDTTTAGTAGSTETSSTQTDQSQQNAAANAGTQTNAAGTNTNDQQDNNHFNDVDLVNQALTRTQLAIKHVWENLFNAVTASLKDQYHYIQQAYNNGQK